MDFLSDFERILQLILLSFGVCIYECLINEDFPLYIVEEDLLPY